MGDEINKEELIVNGLIALIAMIPEVIAVIQNSSSDKKDEWLARIKKAQESWPTWA